MKKSLYAIGMCTLFALQANAQKSETAFISKSSILNNPYRTSGELAKAKTSSTAAEDRFKKEFGAVENARWTEKTDGYRVYFTKDDVVTAVDYTFNGKMYSIIKYGKKLLGAAKTGMIEKRFDEPVIREVSEVQIANYSTIVYIVVLEDQTSVKTLQIIDNDIEVLHEQLKR